MAIKKQQLILPAEAKKNLTHSFMLAILKKRNKRQNAISISFSNQSTQFTFDFQLAVLGLTLMALGKVTWLKERYSPLNIT